MSTLAQLSRLAGAQLAASNVPANRVVTASVTDASITHAKLADDAVDSDILADDAVTTAKIADDAITNALMADDAVGIAQLSATGSASSTTYLRGDNSWATIASGVPAFGVSDSYAVGTILLLGIRNTTQSVSASGATRSSSRVSISAARLGYCSLNVSGSNMTVSVSTTTGPSAGTWRTIAPESLPGGGFQIGQHIALWQRVS